MSPCKKILVCRMLAMKLSTESCLQVYRFKYELQLQLQHVAINDSGLRQNEYSVMKVDLHFARFLRVGMVLFM